MPKVDNDLEELMSFVGPFGRYQMCQFVLLALASVNAGVHMISLVSVAATPEHRCFVPSLDNTTLQSAESWNTSEVLQHVPLRAKTDKLDSCHLMDDGNASEWTGCDRWVFDDTHFSSSRTIDWNLVCGNRWKGALAQSVYMLGLLVGAVLLGNQADRFGRKPVLFAAAVLQLVVGVGVAFVPELYSFLLLRFLYGIGTVGTLSSSFVLLMEIVGPAYRTGCGMAFQSCFSIGIISVTLWWYLVPNNCQVLQAIYGLHSLLLIPNWWLVDESPRWLWSQGQTRDAIRVVSRASRLNYGDKYKSDIANFLRKDSATADATRDVAGDEPAVPSVGIIDLFKTPNMCKRMFNVSFNWFANSLVYYGLALNTNALAGNPYLNLFIAAVVDVPSYILTGILMNLIGRRSLIAALMVLGGLACISAAYIPPEAAIAATAIVMIGKFFIAGSFAIIYNYSTELFPTAVRNTALGMSSMSARISGALTPFVGLLDSLDPSLPSTIFGCVSIASGLLALFLPETLGRPLPQTMEEGERFGEGDTAFSQCCGRRPASRAASERGRRASPSRHSLQPHQDSHEMS